MVMNDLNGLLDDTQPYCYLQCKLEAELRDCWTASPVDEHLPLMIGTVEPPVSITRWPPSRPMRS